MRKKNQDAQVTKSLGSHVGGGGRHGSCNASLSQSNVQKKQQSSCEGDGGGGLKFEKKNARKQSPHLRKNGHILYFFIPNPIT